MVLGEWDRVTPESDEDVVLERADAGDSHFIQVKTVEHPSQLLSPASVCRPEVAGRPDTSILGRLISGKSFPENARLILATNERVNPELRPITTDSQLDRSHVESDLGSRLSGLQPVNRNLAWCIERTYVEECENSADGLEAQVLMLAASVASARGFPLLASELDVLLSRLIGWLQARSRDRDISAIEQVEMQGVFDGWLSDIVSNTGLSIASPNQALRPKLEAAGLSSEEIRKCEEMRFRFSRQRRSAVGEERASLDGVADEIAMACLGIKAERSAGTLAAGLPSVHKTLQKVSELHASRDWETDGVPLATAYGVLHDVTGRCQNRYVDD
jgi:hypothetical protein